MMSNKIDNAAVRAQVAKVFANSKAVKPEGVTALPVSKNGSLRISDTEIHYYPVADTYAQSGKSTNFSAEAVIAYKSMPLEPDTERKAFLRFDLSDFEHSSVGGAFLELTNTMLYGPVNYATALEVTDDRWTDTGLTWENMPSAGAVIDRAQVAAQGAKVTVDLTGFVNRQLRQGRKVFSISIQNMERHAGRTEFSSRRGMNPPVIRMAAPGAAAGSVAPPEIAPPPDDRAYNYITVQMNQNSAPPTEYEPIKTRALSSLGDFKPGARPMLGRYGGDKTRPDKATGFFYVRNDGGRWWMVDPEGYRVLNMGLVEFAPGNTPNGKAGQQAVYGGDDAWAKKATAHIKDDLGFNGMGAWSSDELVMRNHPFPYTKIIYFVTGYAEELGQAYQQSGHKGFVNDVLPVFDPAFEEFADKLAASTFTKLKNDPYLIGYFSDNELPVSINLFDKYLAIDENDETGRFSRAVAWEWLRRRYGIDAVPARVNGRDRDDFRDFIYDYYAQIVTAAVKRYTPNHLYFGPRIHFEAKTSAGIWRALGRYCDAIALNYYHVWEPDFAALAQWEEWSGKPVIITEWYVKGMDAGLTNTSGAGWVVPTQNDRGLFYEQFVLALIESGLCVGWHWFKYFDNDPNAPAPDPSNADSNKGIINTAFQEYTALTGRMKVVNFNVYRLADYFDNKKGKRTSPPRITER
jgi:hypothetical protein